MSNIRYLSDKDLRPVSFKVDPKLYTQCKIYCADKDITIKKFFELMLEDFFKKHASKKYF